MTLCSISAEFLEYLSTMDEEDAADVMDEIEEGIAKVSLQPSALRGHLPYSLRLVRDSSNRDSSPPPTTTPKQL